MDRYLKVVSLSALFHDIGKFYQRASGRWKKRSHTKFSLDFLKEEAVKKKLQRMFSLSDSDYQSLIRAVELHHGDPKDNISYIVQKSDRLSSGLDRVYAETEEFSEEDKEVYKTLLPQFVLIEDFYSENSVSTVEELPRERREWGYYFKPLSTDAVFPIKTESYARPERENDYKNLWNNFFSAFLKLPEQGDFNFKSECLRSLLINFLWCVPSYTYSGNKKLKPIPDIPLAHHLLTSAAIATALWRYEESTGFRDLKDAAKPKFLLLSLDFSGIQNFIFSPPKDTRKWAAKILRARSFLVSLALENVIREVLKEFEVNYFSFLMNAGGKARLLLPNYEDSESRFERVRSRVVDGLFNNFFGEVKLKFSCVELSEEDLYLANFEEKLQELAEKESENRFQLFKVEDFERLNQLFKKGYCKEISEGELCPVCGKRKAEKGLYDYKVCPLCFKLTKLGENLPKKGFIKVRYLSDSELYPFPEIDLIGDVRELKGLFEEKGLGENESVYAFSVDSGSPYFLPHKLLENYVPVYDSSKQVKRLIEERCYEDEEREERKGVREGSNSNPKPKNFCHLAMDSLNEKDDGLYGRPYLGVLKADADNMGYILAKGYLKLKSGKSILSLSRLLTLSWFLDFFFTEIVKEKAKTLDIYSVFSGGDDLFLIGPWEKILEFEIWLREDFSRYTCFNPSFSVSAGIVVVKPTLNILLMAEEAESALELSKKDKKGATTVFDRRIDYREGKTLKELLKVADLLTCLSDKGLLSSSFLYKLLYFSRMAAMEGKEVKNMLWRPYLAYYVKRSFPKEEEFLAELSGCLKNVGGLTGIDESSAFGFFESLIRKYSEQISENSVEEEELVERELLYIPIVITLYRRRKYESFT
ncbi:type III-A CRISPR-associated protein Cas10/Csm1 [Thermovibrio sp.]